MKYLFMVTGGANNWGFCEQSVVATSTLKAEYTILSTDAKWLSGFIACSWDLWVVVAGWFKFPVCVEGRLNFTGNESINRRNKHVYVTYHCVLDVDCRG